MNKKKNQIKFFYQILSDIKNNIDTLIKELSENKNDLEGFLNSKPVISKSKYPDLKKLGIITKTNYWKITEIGNKLVEAYENKNEEAYQNIIADILGSYNYNGFRPYAVLCKFLFIKFGINNFFDREEIIKFLCLPINEAIYFINNGQKSKFGKKLDEPLVEAPRPYSYWVNYLKNAGLIKEEENGIKLTKNIEEFLNIFFEDISETPKTKKENKYTIIGRGSNQRIFRDQLLKAYKEKCAISGKYFKYKNTSLLEAAHIIPVSHGGSYDTDNGILMTPDLHKAFDEGAFTFDENYNLILYKDIEENNYIPISKKINYLPDDSNNYPSKMSINYHKKYIFGVGVSSSKINL